MQILDGVTTRGVFHPKRTGRCQSTAPYYALPLRAGITFTYMGVSIDERSRVVDSRDRPFKNVYAAGEIMAGNILTKGYVGGIGLAIGAIFGELAGRGRSKLCPSLSCLPRLPGNSHLQCVPLLRGALSRLSRDGNPHKLLAGRHPLSCQSVS